MSQTEFARLNTHKFHEDPEFANGLAIILGHPETPASEAEINREDDLVLQAKCFFFSRKENLNPPINFAAYKAWLTSPDSAPASGDSSNVPAEGSTEPAYPSSFAHIVELITTGQPVPGIQEIPDTVLEGHDIASEKPRRRKPWEKDEEKPADESVTATSAV